MDDGTGGNSGVISGGRGDQQGETSRGTSKASRPGKGESNARDRRSQGRRPASTVR
jgi:hypothetical protein